MRQHIINKTLCALLSIFTADRSSDYVHSSKWIHFLYRAQRKMWVGVQGTYIRRIEISCGNTMPMKHEVNGPVLRPRFIQFTFNTVEVGCLQSNLRID